MGYAEVCVACNEDGYGPSAFGYYLVRELVQAWREGRREGVWAFELRVTVLNAGAHAFNRALYAVFPEVAAVAPGRDSLIRLERREGEVDLAATFDRLEGYAPLREAYREAVRPHLEACPVAVDVGVPLFARAAADLGVAHRITLFDHSWARTARLLCAEAWEHLYVLTPPPTPALRDRVDGIAGEIEQDERRATEVHLFERWMTPLVFREHWAGLGFSPRTLPGVLGGADDAPAARGLLDAEVRRLGQAPLPEGVPLVLVTAGGTGVWHTLLPRLVRDLVEGPARDYLPVLSDPVVPEDLKKRMRVSGRVRWFEHLRGTAQQVLMPAFERIVTRAGGGTVNDALATRTPLVCVEERQVQVALIEGELRALGRIPDLPETRLDAFARDPGACLDALAHAALPGPAAPVPCHAERPLAHSILTRLAESSSR